MLRVAIRTVSLGLVLSCTQVVGRHEAAIIGGTLDDQHPGAVMLLNLGSGTVCSAAALSRRVVLTAKHCIMQTAPDAWLVEVGARPLEVAGRLHEYAVVDLQVAGDPDVLVQGEGEDIGLALIDEDFGYETYPWAPVLPDGFGDGSEVTLISYGVTNPDDPNSAGVKYTSSASVYGLDQGTFAADVRGCHGDSGGPAIDETGTVVGVASVADLPACGGWTRFERLDRAAGLIEGAIAASGGDGDADADTDADADADTDADADADGDLDGDADGDADADGEPGPTPGGCGCHLAP